VPLLPPARAWAAPAHSAAWICLGSRRRLSGARAQRAMGWGKWRRRDPTTKNSGVRASRGPRERTRRGHYGLWAHNQMGNRIVTGELFRAKTIGAELEPRQIWCWSTCQLDIQRRDYRVSCFWRGWSNIQRQFNWCIFDGSDVKIVFWAVYYCK